MSGTSWVTLATNDSYSLGALVLGNSLRNVGTVHQLTVLVTPGVTKPMRDRLSSVFNNIREVNVLDSRDTANLALLARPDLGITFTKLHCWRLTEFSKAVFLDADTLVLKNCDELFEREEFSAAPDAGWPDCFNSGVFVYKPSEETYKSLLQFAVTHGSFDGGDQGLLNSYFADWSTKDISRHLPFIYNMVSSAFYSYLPALKQYGDKVKIVHFIGPCKPWLQYLDCETKRVRAPSGSEHLQPLLQLWWDIFCNSVHSSLTTEMAGLAGALAQLTLGVPRTPEQIALDEHLRRQAWEEGRFDYMGVDSFENIWQKISETMAEKPESKDDHQQEMQPSSHEQGSSAISSEPKGQVSDSAAVDISPPTIAQISPSPEELTPSPSVPSSKAEVTTVEKPVPLASNLPESEVPVPPLGTSPLPSGLITEQKGPMPPTPTSQASAPGAEITAAEIIKDPAAAVLLPTTPPRTLEEAPTPTISQTEVTQKDSSQTLPSPTPASATSATNKPITPDPLASSVPTAVQPPLSPVKVESVPTKIPVTTISEQIPAPPGVSQITSQPLSTSEPPEKSVPISTPVIVGSTPSLTSPPTVAPVGDSTAALLSSQTAQSVPVSQSPTAPPTTSVLPTVAPSPVSLTPAVSTPHEKTESQKPSEPFAPVVPVSSASTEASKPSEKTEAVSPSPVVTPPVLKPLEKPEVAPSTPVTTVPESSSVQKTSVSPTIAPTSQPSAPTPVGTVPPLVPTTSLSEGKTAATPSSVTTIQKDLPSPPLPVSVPTSTTEPSTPSSAPTSPTDVLTRPMSTALVSVPKTKQKVPTRAPEPPKPPIPMPAPESPSAPSPPAVTGSHTPSGTDTAKTVAAATAPVTTHPKETKTEGLTGQSTKKSEKQQGTAKVMKEKGNLEELPATQLTETDNKLSKKAKDTEHGTDSQAAPEKLPAKTSTKQAKQSKPKAQETPTKSETASAKPASPPATEPASPEAEAAPTTTKAKTKVVKEPRATKEPDSKAIPQQDPALKTVTPPSSPPVGSPPLSPDGGKPPAPVEKSSTEKGTTAAETTEQAPTAPIPPKRKGAKAAASGEGSSKTQPKPTKTAPKPKK